MNNFEKMLLQAIENNRLKLVEGQKKWYKYFISIQELNVFRNNKDGYLIDLYEKQYGKHLVRIIF